MAKFCTYCGKPIPEGGVCDCPASRAAAQQQAFQQPQQPFQQPQQPFQQPQQPYGYQPQPSQPNPTVEKLKGVFGRFIPFVKSYFQDPLGATSAALRQHDLGVSVIIMIIYALTVGFCLLVTATHIVSEAGGSDSMGVPFFLTMGLMIVAAAIVLALRILALFATLRVCKVNAPIMDALIATGVNFLIPACVMILMLIGVLISWYVFLILAALGLVFQIILFANIVTRVFGAKATSAYLFLATLFLCAGMLISAWLNSKLIVQDVKGWYNKDNPDETIGDYIDDFSDVINNFGIMG